MEVLALRLRREGKKLSLDKIHDTPPVRGVFLFEDTRTRLTNELCRGAWLFKVEDHSFNLFPRLVPAEMKRVRGNSFIVVGTEWIGDRKFYKQWPQAWWCRIGNPEDDDPGTFSCLEGIENERSAMPSR